MSGGSLPAGPRDRIVLLGMMASGKSSTGRSLAKLLGWALWDNDDELRAATGHDARSLSEHDGAERTHRLEAEVLARGLAIDHPAVVCAPGSAVLADSGRRLLAAEWVVWLRARPETLAARVAADARRRPFLGADPLEAIRRLYAERRAGYETVADVVVDVDDLDPGQAAARVAEARQQALTRNRTEPPPGGDPAQTP